ncbi:MAG: DUF2818 family protein [Limnobacter sp.]|nr:DUF2818 family protein [Limnobacter sp.]
MNEELARWLVFFIALVFANLPFLSNRKLWVIPTEVKSGGWRVLEVVLGFFLTGLVGVFFESQVGLVHSQPWEFYAVATCLFLVLGFPGFVYRFLWRQ